MRRRLTLLWLLLMGATAISWQLGHGFGFGEDMRLATTAIAIIAFVKARYVMLDFMELRTAPLPLRLVFEGWGVVVCAAVLTLYWLEGVGPT
jgi:hypothetical protein